MEGLKEFGACPESKWPFSKPLLLKKPDGQAYKEADKVKIKEMEQVPLELKAWKQALASGYPIVFGCLLFESFDECNKRGGVVPMPNPEDLSRSSHAGHSMCAVGYSDKEQVFIVRNSWGDQWGDKGYCYIPYNYLLNPKFNGGDSWVFVPETPIINPEDTWFDDDKPVTNDGRGVDFATNPYTIESYELVELVWWEEIAIEFDDTPPAQYIEYVEFAESDSWDSMESFDYNEVVEIWKEENPGEEIDLNVYDGVDEDASTDDAEDSDTEDADEEVSEDDSDDAEDSDAEATDEEASENDGDDAEDSDAEAADEDGGDGGDDSGGDDGGGESE
jgi:hypothetical protein